ncbi:Autophagy-related protein [Sparassis crispa]|uniref:Autophagy-related protein n=1 Tax=Sparassis crispa TaxID=139825 RepID=A0A401GUH1_9APHY|nr:Autophagy-related protein [Sparassis crispa]GBE85868.1 Autophagy-related protein [Sparassis crispa]
MAPFHDDDSEAPEYNDRAYKRQLGGWLSYAFASEVFVIVSLTLFLPICLEQFARDNGFLLPDRTQPCTSALPTPAKAPKGEEERCVVKLGWMWIDSASFSLYVYSISVALQALTVISMGGIADHSAHRKRLLLAFAGLGSACATLFLALPSSSPVWVLAAPLAILANVGFGASIVALNAYLPALARGTKEVIATRTALWRLNNAHPLDLSDDSPSLECESEHPEEEAQPHHPLLSHQVPATDADVVAAKAAHDSALSSATARISAQGIALGYAAGIAMLLLALVPVRMLGGSTFALRLAVGLSGLWWALFSVPAAIWLPGSSDIEPKSSLSLADGEAGGIEEGERERWNTWREVRNAWRRLGGMLQWREIRRLRNTFVYLFAWFLLSDGFTTITSTAILFAKTTLHMTPFSLIIIGVLTPTAGILGSLIWPVLQRRAGWTNLRILVTLVGMGSAIPAYGCLGFLPIFQKGAHVGGLTTPGEMYVLAVYFGSVYGAFQGYARAFYAELIPPGEEARWYGLFSITDKSSSFVGPLIVGLIADTTGNIRYAFFFLVLMIWLAIPALMSVDVERGREDARAYTYHLSP